MSVAIGASPAKKKFVTLKKANIMANGSEQTLFEYEGEARISGYIDLSDLEPTGAAVITQYIKVLEDANWQIYAQETYTGQSKEKVVYITPKENQLGLKVTLQQTVGLFKNFDNHFIGEI